MFFKKHATIYEQGTMGEDCIYYLKRGTVKVFMTTYSGKERTIEIITNERIFGEQTVDRKPYFSSAKVLDDAVVYCIEGRTIKDLLKKDPDLRLLLFDSLRNKLELLVHTVVMDKLPAEQLLARSIIDILAVFNTNQIPLTQQELSQYTGLTRVTIYTILRKWGPEKIKAANRHLIVTDPKSIEEIAGKTAG
nr:Crp/Fnr family transcriptional regulator [Bacillus piscicola]